MRCRLHAIRYSYDIVLYTPKRQSIDEIHLCCLVGRVGHFDPFRRLSGSDDEMIRRIYIFGTYIHEFTEGGTIMHRAIYTTHVTFAYLYERNVMVLLAIGTSGINIYWNRLMIICHHTVTISRRILPRRSNHLYFSFSAPPSAIAGFATMPRQWCELYFISHANAPNSLHARRREWVFIKFTSRAALFHPPSPPAALTCDCVICAKRAQSARTSSSSSSL